MTGGGHSVGFLISAMALESRLARALRRAVFLVSPAALTNPCHTRTTRAEKLDRRTSVTFRSRDVLHENILHQNSVPFHAGVHHLSLSPVSRWNSSLFKPVLPVMTPTWEIFGVYRLQDGRQVVCTNPMTPAEVGAYQSHPDTFFGVQLSHAKNAKDPLELFDFFYGAYKHSTREKLLSFLSGSKEFEELRSSSDEELLFRVCEQWVYGAIRHSGS
jgi:hypothetical protein